MPSHFKYRIKKASESELSMWDYNCIPTELLESLKESGVYSSTDSNIVPATCAFISKVLDNGYPMYLCGIKLFARRTDLIASNEVSVDREQTVDGSGMGKVSGALKIEGKDDLFYSATHFKCKYIDINTGKLSKEGVGMEETILFPMCNCYSPRGGIAITHFDGAVKGSEALGYAPEAGVTMPNAYNVIVGEETDDNFQGPIPDYVVENARQRYPHHPPKLGFIFMMLNARATITPCCWWVGKNPLIYKPEYFRVIDLAVAQEYFKRQERRQPTNSSRWGVSNIADYVYRGGDYYYPNEGDNYFKNILLGRNFDETLPICGNNQRIIYVLDSSVVGELTKDSMDGDTECKDIPWHFDTNTWFSPSNCSHPDCKVKYQWGAVCNGGGAFDLANGKACPHYENPLIGPEQESDKYCTLNKMYAGDSITAAAVLEMMWFCKGGLPWTKEEWESLWRTPYIWTTMPFNPKKEMSNTFRDPDGNMITSDEITVPRYHVYAIKTEIDLSSGKVKQSPAKLLPGGSITQRERRPDSAGVVPGLQTPDLPTLIQEIEMNAISSLNIIWPVTDLSMLSFTADSSDDYAKKLREAKSKPYNHLVWGPKSKNILVMGYGSGGQYANGVYCINTAFLVGEWAQKKERLQEKVENLSIIDSETQSMLKKLWRDLLRSQVTGGTKVLDGMDMQRETLDGRGLFIFKSVPLNVLYEENFILVFGFSHKSIVDVAFTKVNPIFKRAHLYQSSSTLMTGWKTVWTGRPSLFYNEIKLAEYAGDDYKDTKGRKVNVELADAQYASSFITGSETLEFLSERAEVLTRELENLNKQYSQTEDYNVREHLARQIDDKVTALERVKQSIRNYLDQQSAAASSATTGYVDEERQKLEAAIEILDTEIENLKSKKQEAQNQGYSKLATFYSNLIDEVKYNQAILQKELDSLPTEDEEEQSTDETEEWEMFYGDINVDRSSGGDDTCEGGYFESNYPDPCISSNGSNSVLSENLQSRLYVPFLNSKRKYHRSVDQYTGSLIPQKTTKSAPTLSVPDNSGIASWKYFELDVGEQRSIKPYLTFAPKGAKRVVVYTTRNFSSNFSDDAIPGVKLTDELGRWYSLSSCSSMIVLILNPELANRHNEFMIFSLTAEVSYRWKGADGSYETLTRRIKFAPFNYTQVSREFPGYSVGLTSEDVGEFRKFGVTHRKVSVSENVEILEKPESNRHPWVFFAIACDEDSEVHPWPNYNGLWFPGGNLNITTLPYNREDVDLYIDYAFIGEVYDQDDRKFKDWEENQAEHHTRILFNHPKAGTIRTIFKLGEGNVGELAEGGEDSIDGFKSVPIGSSASTTLWPYARLACRDYEIHYIWRDDYKNTQTTENFFMARKEPRTCGGPNKRYTYYTHGDHDLGTIFKPKITFGHWVGRGRDRTWEEDEIGYSWNTGRYTEEGDPTKGFPSEAGESCGPKNNEGPLYYPYTRAEPHSKFVPVHPVYIWDFLLHYRNKPTQSKYFGGFRMRASDICHIGPAQQRKSRWEVHYEFEPKNETHYLGRGRTRGPLFQLEYDDYQEKKPRIVFLKPYAARSSNSSGATWTYYTDIRSTKAEEWDPDKLADYDEETTPIADNPSDLTKGVWKAVCRGLFLAWSNGDESAYFDLEEQANWGKLRGWVVEYENGLRFPDEEEYEPPNPPDVNEDRRLYLEERIQFYRNWIAKLEEEKNTLKEPQDRERIQQLDKQIVEYKAVLDSLSAELVSLGGDPSYEGGGDSNEFDESPETPEKAEESEIDLLTGCHKSTLQVVDQRGSFFFDNTYMPTSVTSSDWLKEMEEEASEIKKKMQRTSNRFYWYEQKSFGTNLPWSPYDSPPLFGNTGREMYIVELCTIGSVISWLPTTNEDVSPTKGKTNVPSWWTSREPKGDPLELVTLLPPPNECTRALTPLSSEPQNPLYGYIFNYTPFEESFPNYNVDKKPSDIRIITKHDTDNYGKSWYRSDVGRMTMTLTSDSDMAHIKVYGDSPATREFDYQRRTTAVSVGGDASAASQPNEGDVDYDKTLPQNAMWGKDIKGLAIESGEEIFVGRLFPGFSSPYVHGKTFVGYKTDGNPIHWAWPKSNRDIVIRGTSLVKWWTELPKLGSVLQGDVQSQKLDGYLDSIHSIKCAPYVVKNSAADDGREISLGPELKRDVQEKGERETLYKDETYYIIIVESQREQGGLVRPPLIWAQQIDNKDLIPSLESYKKPKDGAVAHRINEDGSLTPVTIGKETTGMDTAFSTGYLFPKSIRNLYPGGNFITSDTMNAAGMYPALELSSIPVRHIGKVFFTKDYREDLNKYKLTKIKNRYGYNNHLVESELLIPRLSADVLYVEILFNNYFVEGVSNLFKNRNDGASVEIIFEGDPVDGLDFSLDTYSKSYLLSLPLEDAMDVKSNRVYCDLDFGLAKSMKIKFKWYVRCNLEKFDEGPWKGDERSYNQEKDKWEYNVNNLSYLNEVIDKITLGTLLPGKCAEIITIKEASFIVSTGQWCRRGRTGGEPYNFYTDSNSADYKCGWKESEKDTRRKWNQESLFLDSKSKGEKPTDEWAQSGYEKMLQSYNEFKSNSTDNDVQEQTSNSSYKLSKAQVFENSCVELPELPQSKLKIQAWENQVGEDSEGRTWTWGGVWTTRVAGPEWRTADPYPSRDYIWWPAPHYNTGSIIMKGRAWFFSPQYKDEARVMEDKREATEDGYNDNAYVNELTGFDKLVRNIQEFEAYRSDVRKGQASQESLNTSVAQQRKDAATQRSLDSMYSSAGGGMGGNPAPNMAPTNRNFVVNEYKAYNFLDEVGLTPENATWSSIKTMEEERQQGLYKEAVDLKSEGFSDNSIKATAIIPYYDWKELMEITDSEWAERNSGGDRQPLTISDLSNYKDEECSFTWKVWGWQEVQSFTFRDEHKDRYSPETSDLSKSGLLRECGRKWKIFGNAKPKKSAVMIAKEALEATKAELNDAKSDATDQLKQEIEGVVIDIDAGISLLGDVDEFYINLGKSLWEHYSTSMGSGYGVIPEGYNKNPNIINQLEEAIENSKGTGGYIDQLSDITNELDGVSLSSRKLNKSLLEATESSNSAADSIEQLVSQMGAVKQKMEYYNNVTEDLQRSTRDLITDLGATLGKTETKVDKIECHGSEDDDPKGECDKDGYPQKWDWDSDRDVSAEWPSDVSEDGGSTLKRPDPWWRY